MNSFGIKDDIDNEYINLCESMYMAEDNEITLDDAEKIRNLDGLASPNTIANYMEDPSKGMGILRSDEITGTLMSHRAKLVKADEFETIVGELQSTKEGMWYIKQLCAFRKVKNVDGLDKGGRASILNQERVRRLRVIEEYRNLELGDSWVSFLKKVRDHISGKKKMPPPTKAAYVLPYIPLSYDDENRDEWCSRIAHSLRTKKGSAIQANSKTIKSIDFDTVCPKRIIDKQCKYCYVENGRCSPNSTNAKDITVGNTIVKEISRINGDVISSLNAVGGLRMFSASDYNPRWDSEIESTFKIAEEKGLKIKVITKRVEFLERFDPSKYPAMNVVNLSIDNVGDGVDHETALAWKERSDKVVIRTVILNEEDLEAIGKYGEVNTFFHGNVRSLKKKHEDMKDVEIVDFSTEDQYRDNLMVKYNLVNRTCCVPYGTFDIENEVPETSLCKNCKLKCGETLIKNDMVQQEYPYAEGVGPDAERLSREGFIKKANAKRRQVNDAIEEYGILYYSDTIPEIGGTEVTPSNYIKAVQSKYIKIGSITDKGYNKTLFTTNAPGTDN